MNFTDQEEINLDFNEELSQKLGQYCTNLIGEISNRLNNFLHSLRQLYEGQGIYFPVMQNYTNFMRILTPFQLLSKFQVATNNQILSEQLINRIAQKIQPKGSFTANSGQNSKHGEGIVKSSFNYIKKPQKLDPFEKYPMPSVLNEINSVKQVRIDQKPIDQEVDQMLRQHQQKQRKLKQKEEMKIKLSSGPPTIEQIIKSDSISYGYRKKGIVGKKQQMNFYARNALYMDGPRAKLPKELQQQLEIWVEKKLRKGETVLHRDIVKKAKQLGRNIPHLAVGNSYAQRFIQKSRLYALYRQSKKGTPKIPQTRFTYISRVQSNNSNENQNESQQGPEENQSENLEAEQSEYNEQYQEQYRSEQEDNINEDDEQAS